MFDSPYACTVRQLGPQGRKERKRAGNLFRKWLRLIGQSTPRAITDFFSQPVRALRKQFPVMRIMPGF